MSNMNLKPCTACGRSVSSEAVNCPHCGQPLQKKSFITKELGAGGAFYALLLVAGFVLGMGGLLVGWVMFFVGLGLLVFRVIAFRKS